ncbi:GNAT family N-acetyltransferase [Microbacterium sp. Leaf159]|uniref:GNAT family N-acetyltransferase n=1 Tax=Microbacterium sp. Leaf159 TaxID=1736279 RepID=UPI000701CF4D|nr:GNAT family N-acetyltransferase [Microbacterium sp. Leaf159]KQR39792.1 hypothetical protein ASF80_10535 [Microbacterium sp. Leaf159]
MNELFVVTLAGPEAAGLESEVLEVWSDVFGAVADADDWRASIWERHRSRAGFRLVTAREGDRLVGFAWGYTGERGQYWSDFISRELGPRVDEWIGGHFEFVELAVIPDARGRGIGRALHDALLADLLHERALLSTSARADDPAVRLYSSSGWIPLATYQGDRQVMGRMSSGAQGVAPS